MSVGPCRRRMLLWAVAAGLLGALMVPAAARAFFPPVLHYPYPVPIQTPPVVLPPVVVPPVVVPPPPPVVGPQGNPDPEPPPIITPPVATTPEPATLVAGLVGLVALGGWSLRRRRRALASTA